MQEKLTYFKRKFGKNFKVIDVEKILKKLVLRNSFGKIWATCEDLEKNLG